MINDKEFVIFCDESDKTGKFYSNFYGGVLVGSSGYERITEKLNNAKTALNLFGEVKWEKVTERYLEKYKDLVSIFFTEVKKGNVKVRIMFRQNAKVPKGLKKTHIEEEYYILYYFFVKNAFGLGDLPSIESVRNLRLYFDTFPQQKAEKIEKFKGYLTGGIQTNPYFKRSKILLLKDNITEVRSHDHVLLQCLDIVLGSISFRLNDKHKAIPQGKKRRGKKTIAKHKLYSHILNEVRGIRKNFNIGMSSRTESYLERFTEPYLHWCFTPREFEYDESKTKSKLRTKGKK